MVRDIEIQTRKLRDGERRRETRERKEKGRREGRHGIQQQLRQKAALEYGSLWSEGRAWSSQGPSASHHWSGAVYFL
jgi:hypothetical protein